MKEMAYKLKPFFLIIVLILILSTFFPLSLGQFLHNASSEGGMNNKLHNGASANASFILAARETHRKDPLNHFHYYKGGWNIVNVHYLASVAYSSAPFAMCAIVWFVLFGLFFFCVYVCWCCWQKESYGYSEIAYQLSLTLLILFTLAAIYGCAMMYIGDARFQDSLHNATDYIVNQGLNIMNKLIHVYNCLCSAKDVSLNRQFLPTYLVTQIDEVESFINSTGSIPYVKSAHITKAILSILIPVNIVFILITVFMLLLAFLGFVFSILGNRFCVNIFVVIGWITVTLALILCGIFLVFHNTVADTCLAMEEWVQNPMADSSIKELLPCVNKQFGQKLLNISTSAASSMDNILNHYIVNVANNDTKPLSYNQSGPLVPLICEANKTHNCRNSKNEVPLSNASKELKKYVCEVSESGICISVGRLTPRTYNLMRTAINVSYELYEYGDFLAGVVDCRMTEDTIEDISRDHCPKLMKYSQWVYVGLVIATYSVMFSVICWLFYSRERQHRKYTKKIDKEKEFPREKPHKSFSLLKNR